ncbi:MAG: hypothetical protein OHK0046_42080 [Anaerolineae bacterium]
MKRLMAMLWIVLVLLVGMPVITQEDTVAPGSAGYIAFSAPGENSDDIVVADLATENVLNLSNNTVLSAHPTWSGDGSQIAYNNVFADSAGNFTDIEVFVMDDNGLNPRNVTSHPAFDVSPDWSPVANDIAFQSNRDGGTDLYVVNVDSGETRRLTTDGTPKNRPEWSPDGAQIAYWELNADGSIAMLKVLTLADLTTRVLVDSGQNLWPAWSPDGRYITVHDETSGAFSQIYRVDVTTGERTLLSDGTANDMRAEWSPDGTQLSFYSDRAGTMALFVMNADGSNIRLFSEDIGRDLSASWRPTAPAINFAANPNLGLSAVRVNADTIDAADQYALGAGIRRLYAPRETYYENPVSIRLEIQLDDPNIVPEGDPVAELRDEGSIEVYRIMGAELEGQDLEDFTLLPNQNAQLLQIQDDQVNFWDWRLIPNGPESVGRKFLLVNIYLPDVDDDGVVTKEILESILLEFEVTAADIEDTGEVETVDVGNAEVVYDATASQLYLPGEAPPQGFTIYHNSRDLLAIQLAADVDFLAMRVASDAADYTLMQTFPALAAYEGSGLPGDYCLFYERDGDGVNPVLPLACQTPEQLGLLLNPGDVFWYNSSINSLRDLIIRLGDQSFLCPVGFDRCEF